MPTFTIEVEYQLPIYQTRVVRAATLEEACQKALNSSEDDWATGAEDRTNVGATYVTAAVKGKHENCHEGAEQLKLTTRIRAMRPA